MSANDCKDPKKPDECEGATLCPLPPKCPPVQNITHPLRYYEFTEDEMRVLEECDRESFYGRCLPLSAVFATLTYAAVKGGYMRRNPRFGAVPKMTLAVVLGYVAGKLSYSSTCAEKLMALPGSYVGQLLQEQRQGPKTGGSFAPPQSKSMLGAEPADIYSDAGPGFSLDLDADAPLQPRAPPDHPRFTGDTLNADPGPPGLLGDPGLPTTTLPHIVEEHLKQPEPLRRDPQLPEVADPTRSA